MKLDQLKKRLQAVNEDFNKLVQQEKTIQVLKAQLQGQYKLLQDQIKELTPKKK